jgi:hypothetical protein
MNSSIKSVHFSKWLRKKIGSRVHFCRKYGWKSREILRWTQGDNFPKGPARAQLIYDLHLHIDQEYTSLLAECDEKLMRDYKEYKYEQEKIRRQSEKETATD